MNNTFKKSENQQFYIVNIHKNITESTKILVFLSIIHYNADMLFKIKEEDKIRSKTNEHERKAGWYS